MRWQEMGSYNFYMIQKLADLKSSHSTDSNWIGIALPGR